VIHEANARLKKLVAEVGCTDQVGSYSPIS
jgi:hypothetical protein